MPSIEQLSRLLEREPNDPFLLYGIAQEHAKAGNAAAAIEHFDRCLAADPAYCYAYYHKAKVLIGAGRQAEARTVIDAGKMVATKAGDSHARGELLALECDLD